MKLFIGLASILCLTGCAPMLGAHVTHFEHQGVQYSKCLIVTRADEPQLAAAALDICRDALRQPGQPAPVPARH